MEQREPKNVVLFYHDLPHVNISFADVGNKFNPSNPQYVEALGILATIPVLWLLLTLIILLTYFLTRCCDKQLKVPRALEAHRWVLGFTAVLCCGAVAVGLYGNDDFHNGAVGFATALQMIQNTIDDAQSGYDVQNVYGLLQNAKFYDDAENLNLSTNASFQWPVISSRKISVITRGIQEQIEPPAKNLTKLLEKVMPNENLSTHKTLVQQMRFLLDNVTSVSDNLKLTEHTMRGVNFQSVASGTNASEMIRWPMTIALLSFFIFLCLVLVYGIVKGSRCTILLFTVFGLISIVLNWLLASFYLVSAVGGSDLCTNPGGYFADLTRDASAKELVSYYVFCNKSDKLGPLDGPIRDARKAIEAADNKLKQFAELSKSYYSHMDVHPTADRLKRHLGTAAHNLSTLAGMLDCRPTNQQYRRAVLNACELGIFGLTFMLLSSIGTGLLLTILVWVGSHVWIYLKTRKGYLQVADQEPFMPLSASSASRTSGSGRSPYAPNAPPGSNTNSLRYHTRHSHTPPQTPPFPGTLHVQFSNVLRPAAASESRKAGYSRPPLTRQPPALGGRNGKITSEDRDRTLTLRKTQETSLTVTNGRRSPPPFVGPNNGQYATLSKSCKTLESADFY